MRPYDHMLGSGRCWCAPEKKVMKGMRLVPTPEGIVPVDFEDVIYVHYDMISERTQHGRPLRLYPESIIAHRDRT